MGTAVDMEPWMRLFLRWGQLLAWPRVRVCLSWSSSGPTSFAASRLDAPRNDMNFGGLRNEKGEPGMLTDEACSKVVAVVVSKFELERVTEREGRARDAH